MSRDTPRDHALADVLPEWGEASAGGWDEVARPLLAWYDRHRRRHLPWREQPDPYSTLVSEFMLQQTRVETVIPYFERFMQRFPVVEDLAAAEQDEVLELWSGLGYYSRGRNLHKAAGMIVARGAFPDSVETLRELPGVGPYMAGAVASIALGLDVATVDGNIERVLSRLHRYGGGKAGLWELAGTHVPAGRAGDYNQALMDLGSSVCTPRTPACLVCPLGDACAARAAGDPEAWPIKVAKTRAPARSAGAAVRRGPQGVLLVKRPSEGLFGGLYDLPWDFLGEQEGPEEAASRALTEATQLVAQPRLLGEVRHTLTHMRLTLHLVAMEGPGQVQLEAPHTWVDPADPGALGISTLARKALALVARSGA